MARHIKPILNRSALVVGALPTVVIGPIDARGHDGIVLALDNDAADTFNATVEASVDGTWPGFTIPNDEFQAMGPGASRYVTLDANFFFVRVLGAFAGAGGQLRRSAALLRGVSHPG